MDPDTGRALELLDRIASAKAPDGPVALSAEYLRDVARVEDSPLNQSGSDKTQVDVALRVFLAGYDRVRRVG